MALGLLRTLPDAQRKQCWIFSNNPQVVFQSLLYKYNRQILPCFIIARLQVELEYLHMNRLETNVGKESELYSSEYRRGRLTYSE